MNLRSAPRVRSVPAGAPFLPTLVETLLAGELIPDFTFDGDPLSLADVTIYVPTRRSARELRRLFGEFGGGRGAILPVVRPLGEADEDDVLFVQPVVAELDLPAPIPSIDRLLGLSVLVGAWKKQLPGHVAARFDEAVVIPVSTADSLWLARDLAQLIDDVETEGTDWNKLAGLAEGELAGWWQVTLDFLEIVTRSWPEILDEIGFVNPGAHRNALLRREAERLAQNPPRGPVIAAGSTGSIPATADLLAVIARLPRGAVVLPGFDRHMDDRVWAALTDPAAPAPVLGHPQYGLARLVGRLGILREEVEDLGSLAPAAALRSRLIGEALCPAATTEAWPDLRKSADEVEIGRALAQVTWIEAANERDEALAIAIALRRAIDEPGKRAALVTGDRDLARRVSAELLRFGVRADDSGGVPLLRTPPGELLLAMLRAVFEPGDPVAVLTLLKHPLLRLGLPRPLVRRAAETIELVALRGGVGRPDVLTLRADFEARLSAPEGSRAPFWSTRLKAGRLDDALSMLAKLEQALAPLALFREAPSAELAAIMRATVLALEDLGRDEAGAVAGLYGLDAGEALAAFLRTVVASRAPLPIAPGEWPDVLGALIAPETVRPRFGTDRRIVIWGQLEARLQSVDTLVLGGLNEGNWPRKAEADRFLSRMMRIGIELEPPERRIGLAAHDFQMALGTPEVILTRSARTGDAPAVSSRWLQRILTYIGAEQASDMRARGDEWLAFARALDVEPKIRFARRPRPTPPIPARPRRFSVTEIETLRRDPYAIYARRVLGLAPLDPLVRDPAASERGMLFHDIMHRFSERIEAGGTEELTLETLLAVARESFRDTALPDDVQAIWWPRFEKLSKQIIVWERGRGGGIFGRRPESVAVATEVGKTGVVLSGRADRIDLRAAGFADILDYKTGSSPSKVQAHTLVSPQLPLEGALLMRGAFRELGKLQPAELAFIRMRPNGRVDEESILEVVGSVRSAPDLSQDAWKRLEELLVHYNDPTNGYLSRALPFREGEMDGDYDHLARVLEWSSGGDGEPAEGEGE